MRVKYSIDDMWHDILEYLLQHGHALDSRVGGCKEILAFSESLCNLEHTFLLNPRRNLCPHYAAAETLWYLSGSDRIDMISQYAPQYVKFAEDDGHAHGAYGKRMRENVTGYHQLDLIRSILGVAPNSRQAILTLWNANSDLVHAYELDKRDLPCTLTMQFFVRQGCVCLIVTMRSNDIWLGTPYDVFAFTTIQKIIADSLNMRTGTYTHQVGSMHLYDKHYDKAQDAIKSKLDSNTVRLDHNYGCGLLNLHESIKMAVELETAMRTGDDAYARFLLKALRRNDKSGCLTDLPLVAGLKWASRYPQIADFIDEVRSNLFKTILARRRSC